MSDPTVPATPAPRKSEIALELALAYLRDGTLSIDGDGCIWRHYVHDRHGGRKPVEPRRAENPTHKGYLAVTLGVPGTRGTAKVYAHVLGWTWRAGPIPAGMQVNHKDLNKANNRPDNHELVTGSGNIQHSYANGRARPWSAAKEWRPGVARRTPEQDARVVELRRAGKTLAQISASEGVSETQVARILKKTGGVQ